MRTSQAGVDLIKHFESCRLIGYLDAVSIPTIGWGHTGPDVRVGSTITQQEADRLLEDDLVKCEQDVDQLVTVMIAQRHFDALVSFTFNVGSDMDADKIAEGLGDSTLLAKLNAVNFQGAADEFPKWCKAGGVVLKGLQRRRAAERAMFLGQDWQAAAAAIA